MTTFRSHDIAPDPVTLRTEHNTALDEDHADLLDGEVGSGASATWEGAPDPAERLLTSSLTVPSAETPTAPRETDPLRDFTATAREAAADIRQRGETGLSMDLMRVIWRVELELLR